ncbi:hypothetical protein QFZ54_001625 [Sphingomonas faeni]|nr:hypothetical protein [Sphingomonas faeni]
MTRAAPYSFLRAFAPSREKILFTQRRKGAKILESRFAAEDR